MSKYTPNYIIKNNNLDNIINFDIKENMNNLNISKKKRAINAGAASLQR